MGVVLTILKIIGIILLVILCIILALLLIVLFVPFRYEAHVVKEDRGPDAGATEGLKAKAGVTWLLHFVTFHVFFEDGKLRKALKILGINLSKEKPKEKKKKKKTPKEGEERPLSEIAEAHNKKKKAPPEPEAGTQAMPENASADTLTVPVEEEDERTAEEIAEEAAAENETAAENEAVAENEPAAENAPETEDKDSGKEASGGGKKKKKKKSAEEKKAAKAKKAEKPKKPHRKKADTFSEFLWRVAEAVYNICRKIAAKIRGVVEKLKAVYAKIRKWTDFLEDERTKAAIALALKEVGGILKGLAPKKIRGYVRFGHDDPYKTGEQLAYLAACYPLYGRSLSIYPDFEKKVLEGDVDIKGRLYLAAIVWAGLKIILNKNIKYVIRFVKNKEENTNGGE